MTLIVVVDDQATNRAVFARLSGAIAKDASIATFSNPEQALAWLPDNIPDLIVTDYKMPAMDGAEFVQHVRRLPHGDEMPVIVITAYEDREFRLRALEAGATDFLRSPVDHQEFVTRGRNVLQLGQHQKAIRAWAINLQQELVRSEESLENTIANDRHRLKQVIDTIPALISASDAEGRRVFENRHSAAVRGQASHDDASARELDRSILDGARPMLHFEENLTDADGVTRSYLTSKVPLFGVGGEIDHVLTTSFDVSDRKRSEQNLDYLAHHDTLTGLPNRLMLHEKLEAALEGVRQGEEPFALHIIDLDRFKSINDGFGHDQGDGLLRETASRLRHTVGSGGTVARLGGDEFAVLQPLPHGMDDAVDLAKRMVEAVSRPVPIESYRATIGASIGITFAPKDGTRREELMKAADLAMYRAKQEGRGCVRLFDSSMLSLARDNVLLEIELRQAFERDEFELQYQPQVDASTGTLVGVETLLRWNRPGRGLLYPGQFLPLAEEIGLIPLIDQWVLSRACDQAAEWARLGSRVIVGVNMSPKTLAAESVVGLVRTVLADTGLDPSLLELELTEGALMQSQQDLATELQTLRQLGVRISIDDFGTGYSSLAYLQRLPIDRLKIDKSFVQDMVDGVDGSAIVKAIVGIGRSLDMEVLAEGIETEGQLRLVREHGCMLVQGYLFGKPTDAATVARSFLAARTPRTTAPVLPE